MFNWLYVNKDLQNNYDVLLAEFNKLTNQNLYLIEKNNELIREIDELNDLLNACSKKFEDNLRYEQIKREEYNYYDKNVFLVELEKHQRKSHLCVMDELKKKHAL